MMIFIFKSHTLVLFSFAFLLGLNSDVAIKNQQLSDQNLNTLIYVAPIGL